MAFILGFMLALVVATIAAIDLCHAAIRRATFREHTKAYDLGRESVIREAQQPIQRDL